MIPYLFVALPVIGLVVLFCIVAFIVTLIRGLFSGPPRLTCGRCGTVRTDTGGRHTYSYPANYDQATCRLIGHAWTTNQPKELK